MCVIFFVILEQTCYHSIIIDLRFNLHVCAVAWMPSAVPDFWCIV